MELVQSLNDNFDKPLSESYTYKRLDSEPREKQMVGAAAERLRREATEMAEFLERSLKELDAAKAEEGEALNRVLTGPGDRARDAAFDRKMRELKQKTVALKKGTLKKLKEIEEVRPVSGRQIAALDLRVLMICSGVRGGEERDPGRTLAPKLIRCASLLREGRGDAMLRGFHMERILNVVSIFHHLAVQGVCKVISSINTWLSRKTLLATCIPTAMG